MRSTRLRPLLLSLLLASGCSSGADGIVSVAATGRVQGLVFLDRDGDRAPSATVDRPVPAMKVTLLVHGTRRVVAGATTDAGGAYVMPLVPVGSYELSVDSASLGDSLRVARVTPAEILVADGDTSQVLLALDRPVLTVAAARRASAGRRVAVEGVLSNSWLVFGDSTLHLSDATGSIRATEAPPNGFAVGDSVRLVGLVGTRDGQPVFLDSELFLLGRATAPAPVALTTAAAARADGGRLDAALVRVTAVSIQSVTPTATGDVRVEVDDGSGPLEVIFDRSAPIASEIPLLPGAKADLTGVLVPTRDGRWQLKPRGSTDLEVGVTVASVAEARGLPAGRLVSVEGVALNGWATFADSTVHLAEGGAAIRVVRVPASGVSAGDRVRVIGTLRARDGQPVIDDPVLTVLRRSTVPDSVRVSTAAAATADGGRLDAALVGIAGATVIDARPAADGSLRVTVTDGSGPLEVLLGPATRAALEAPLLPGVTLAAVGVLAPAGGAWRLRPRSSADLHISLLTPDIASARRLPAGTLVALEAVAVTGWSTFEDATVHLSDRTGAIRAIRVPSAFIFAGDSVRIVGTLSAVNGQPVLAALSGVTPFLLGKAAPPAPAQLSTANAATAGGGRYDAALARVERAVVQDTATVQEGLLVRVNDGSGPLDVLIDSDLGVSLNQFVVGAAFDFVGVLVPISGGRRWILEPRSAADITAR